MTKNEIVARFMGFPPFETERGRRITWPKGKGFFKTGWYIEVFNYDTSYEWLMPAWVKFRDLKFDNEDERDLFYEYRKRIRWAITERSITEAFDELCKGIEWYNSLNEKV